MESAKVVCEEKMKKAISALRDEFNGVRTGRASPTILDKIRVDYYGQKTPIAQVATVSVPEARLIVIQPWDRALIGEIEKAIQKSELSLNPSNDGKVIRIVIPPLTEERRKELAKMAKNMAEQSRCRSAISVATVSRTKEAACRRRRPRGRNKKGRGGAPKTHRYVHRACGKALEEKDKEIMEVYGTRTTMADATKKKKLPMHVGVIMDGNGRWAKSRGLPRTEGHREGLKTAKIIVKAAEDLGIKFLSLYVFSTENWKRATEEVGFLMGLIKQHLGPSWISIAPTASEFSIPAMPMACRWT